MSRRMSVRIELVNREYMRFSGTHVPEQPINTTEFPNVSEEEARMIITASRVAFSLPMANAAAFCDSTWQQVVKHLDAYDMLVLAQSNGMKTLRVTLGAPEIVN